MFGNLGKRLAKKHGYVKPTKCRCKEPTRHRDCAYCGTGYDAGKVCGRCREDGIDGRVIRGTERKTCEKHR